MPTVQARCGCGYLHPVRLSKTREDTQSPHRTYGGVLFAEEHKVSLDTVADISEKLNLREKELDAAFAVIKQYEELETRRREETNEKEQLAKDKDNELELLREELGEVREVLRQTEGERVSFEKQTIDTTAKLEILKLAEMKSVASMRQLGETATKHEDMKRLAAESQAKLASVTEQLHKTQLQLQVNNSTAVQENTSLKQKVADFHERLAYADALKQEHVRLTEAYKDLDIQHMSAVRELQTSHQLVADLRKAAEDAAFKQQELTETLEMVAPVQSEFQERIKRLGDASVVAQQAVAEKETELTSLREQLASATYTVTALNSSGEANTLRASLAEKEDEIVELTALTASLRSDLSKIDKKRTNSAVQQDAIDEFTARVKVDLQQWMPEDTADEHAAIIIALNRCKRAAAADRAQHEDLEDELRTQQDKARDAQDKNRELQDKTRDLQDKLNTATHDEASKGVLQSIYQKLAELPGGVVPSSPKHSASEPAVMPLIERLMTDASETKVQLAALNEQYNQLQDKHSLKEKEYAEVDADRKGMKTNYEAALNEIDALQSQLQDITALSIDTQERTELIKLRGEAEVLTGDRHMLQEAMDTRDAQLRAAERDLAMLRSELAEVNDKNSELNTSLNLTRDDFDKLTLREKMAREHAAKVEREAEESHDSIGLLMLQLSNSEKQESVMRSLLDEKDDKLTRLKNSIIGGTSNADQSPVTLKLEAVEQALTQLQEQREDGARRLETELATLKSERDAWADRAKFSEQEVDMLQNKLQSVQSMPLDAVSLSRSSPMSSPVRGRELGRDLTMQGTPVLLDDLVMSPEMASLKEQLTHAERAADAARQARDAAEIEHRRLPSTHPIIQQLQEAEDRVERIANTIRRKSDLEAAVAKGHSPSIATKMGTLEQRLKGRNSSYNELLLENEELKRQLAAAQQEAEDAAVRVVVAAEEPNDEKIAELTDVIEQKGVVISSLRMEIARRDAVTAEAERKDAEKQQQFNDIGAEREGLELQTGLLKKQVEKLTSEVKEKEGIVQQLHAALKNTSEMTPQAVKDMDVKMVELEAENEMLHEQLAEVRTSKIRGSPLPPTPTPSNSSREIENLKSQNNDLQSEYNALLNDVAQLKDVVTDLHGSIMDEQEGNDTITGKLRDTEAQLESELKSKVAVQKTIQILQEQNIIQQTQLAQRGASQRHKQEIQADVNELQSQYEEAITRTHQMEKEYEAGVNFFVTSKTFDAEVADKVVRAITNNNRELEKEEVHDMLKAILCSDRLDDHPALDPRIESALKQLESEVLTLIAECDSRRPPFARSDRIPLVKRLSIHIDGLLADVGMAASGVPVGEATKIQALLSQETSRRRDAEAKSFKLQQEIARSKNRLSKEHEMQRDIRDMKQIIEELRLDNRNLRAKMQDEVHEKQTSDLRMKIKENNSVRAKRRIKDLEGKVKNSELERQELERVVSETLLTGDRMDRVERRTQASSRASSRQVSPLLSVQSRSPRPTPQSSPSRSRFMLEQEAWDTY
eukprot:TRINITY_DN3875_c4_g1_i1.p1 TRINITY_DN3875_c4_g1~~TRINITY_DN3875_c4_g1_i1.p1  ORF type:complete len:1536 (+),score=449.16 TRINITY_DN3875_c4_g1_i1:75-4610(+)